MNYYEHHLGDYAKDTAHLTMLEHGAYRLLLDRYYGTEQGIPADQAHRVARARTREEKAAVDAVLDEFFTLRDGVWINQRAEEEIEKAKVRIDAAKNNGKRGGRPRKKPAGSETETQQKPGGFSAGSETETQQKAHQAPYTNHHTPEGLQSGGGTPSVVAHETSAAPPPDPAAELTHGADPIHLRACEIVALLRARGARLTASNPTVRGWSERGATDAQLLTAFEIAEERRTKKADPSPINAGFLDAILRDVTAPHAAQTSPTRPSRVEQLNARNQAAIAQAKAAILAREVPSANE